jgi:hypothetical protein
MPIPDRTIQVGSLAVLVSCTVQPQQNGTVCIRIKATVGATTHETGLTIGAKSGPAFDNLTAEQIKTQLQSDLDLFRQKVAQEAAFKEQSRLVANELI